ncbi:MAG: hypothetical protein KKF22_15620 [Gammaproteobacteria bacterium]|nr:hypothetical protein [Gammaproteobacteria bacterium]
MLKKLVVMLAFASTAVVAQQECGYWVTSQVEVCDERTIIVQQPVTQCVYISLPYETRTYTNTVEGHIAFAQCPKMQGYYVNEAIRTYREQRTTERYNCRNETRWTWIPGGTPGGECNVQIP